MRVTTRPRTNGLQNRAWNWTLTHVTPASKTQQVSYLRMILVLKTFLGLRSPCLPAAAVGVTLVDGFYRHDMAKLPYLLVVPIAPASASAFHRGHAAIDDALCPFLSAAYNFINVLYLAMLAYLRVMSNAVATTVSFGIAALDFARDPLLFSSAMLQRGVRDLSKGTKLIVMGGAIAAYQSLLAALGVAALNLTGIPCFMKLMVLGWCKRNEVFRIVVVMVAVFVVNV